MFRGANSSKLENTTGKYDAKIDCGDEYSIGVMWFTTIATPWTPTQKHPLFTKTLT